MKILIVEDNFSDRLILKKLVQGLGHTVFEAENGRVAIDVFNEVIPDVVLLDVVMPEMDGFQVAEYIRSQEHLGYIPILFITSLKETDSLVRCMEAGGDDFFTKPFNAVILKAKIAVFERTLSLYQTVENQRDEIKSYSDHLEREQRVAKRIFDNVAHKGALDSDNIRYSISPMSIFNGDIVLAVKTPLGGLNILVGDFTGHGLPAAIGAIPTSDIFFKMSAKGFELYEIIQEINLRLHGILPTGFFCCTVAAHIDYSNARIQIWNGGLPQAYIVNYETGERETIQSTHVPLGILSPEKFSTKMILKPFTEQHSFFVYTDGVTEAENQHEEMFGEERLLLSVDKGIHAKNVFQQITDDVKAFQGSHRQGDDITYIEIAHKPHNKMEHQNENDSINYTPKGPSDSRLTLELGPESMREFNPLPFFAQHLMEIGQLRRFRAQILTLLTELYSNALDHGILNLDSSLKSSPEGFAEYYAKREGLLSNLQSGLIKINVAHESTVGGGKLFIEIEDDGDGFDVSQMSDDQSSNNYSGRGFALVKELAQSVEFSHNGSKVSLVFHWTASH